MPLEYLAAAVRDFSIGPRGCAELAGWQVSMEVVAHFSGNRGPLFRVGWIRHFFTPQELSKTFFSLHLVVIRGPFVAHSPVSQSSR